MKTGALVAIGVVAFLHVYFMVMEMLLWQTPRVRATFGMTAEFAKDTASLAKNQGLYNGFLAAGLVWGIVADDSIGLSVRIFFTACVVVAGVFGAATANVRILFVQAVPGAIALALTLLSR